MKRTLLIAMLAVGCCPENQKTVPVEPVKFIKKHTIGYGYGTVEEFEIEGHRYLDSPGSSIVHAQHCKCFGEATSK